MVLQLLVTTLFGKLIYVHPGCFHLCSMSVPGHVAQAVQNVQQQQQQQPAAPQPTPHGMLTDVV